MALQDRAKSFLGSLGFIGGDEVSVQQDDQEEFEDDPEEEEKDRPAWYMRFLGLFGFGREEEDLDEEAEEEVTRFSASAPARTVRTPEAHPVNRAPIRDNVIHDERMTGRTQQAARMVHRERVVDVRRIDECKKLIECLLQGETVLICLENMDPKDCGRIVDLLSGAAFALQGRMIKVAHLCYLLAPQSVEIIDEKERTGHAL